MILLKTKEDLVFLKNTKSKITFSVPNYFTHYERICLIHSINLSDIKFDRLLNESNASSKFSKIFFLIC